jgi:DNA-directed RNA polymerase specialized sigma subunit
MNRTPRAHTAALRRRLTTIDRLEATLTAQLGMPPTDTEIAKLLARSPRAISRVQAQWP